MRSRSRPFVEESRTAFCKPATAPTATPHLTPTTLRKKFRKGSDFLLEEAAAPASIDLAPSSQKIHTGSLVLTSPDQEQLDLSTTHASGRVSQLLSDEFFQQQLESKMQLSEGNVSSSLSRDTGENIDSSSRQVYRCTSGSNDNGDAVSEHTSTITQRLHRIILATKFSFESHLRNKADWLPRAPTYNSDCDSERTFTTTATAGTVASDTVDSLDNDSPHNSIKYRHKDTKKSATYSCGYNVRLKMSSSTVSQQFWTP
eukprot:1410-Heterococcus_DN1.PRE.2